MVEEAHDKAGAKQFSIVKKGIASRLCEYETLPTLPRSQSDSHIFEYIHIRICTYSHMRLSRMLVLDKPFL